VLAVRLVYAKTERLPTLATLEPILDHVAKEGRTVHYFGKRSSVVIIAFDVLFNLAQIRNYSA
jgi:hypothetical protein